MTDEIRARLDERSWKQFEEIQEYYSISNRADMLRFLIANKHREIIAQLPKK
ncbi:unnamed protein product [marine sediment metagenome]|uniref:Uncharacterized protein n=1 Tax=marine sediment metagenome TaxID=412755 RepID=X1VW43_9ZZZZ